MRAVLLLIAIALPVLADEASKRKKIEHLLDLLNTRALVDQILDQARENMRLAIASTGIQIPPEKLDQMKAGQDRMLAIIKKAMDWNELKADYVTIYANNLTEAEIDAMVAFYSTPEGASVIKKMPTLMTKGNEVAQQRMVKVMPEIQAEAQRLESEMKGAPPPAPQPPPPPSAAPKK